MFNLKDIFFGIAREVSYIGEIMIILFIIAKIL